MDDLISRQASIDAINKRVASRIKQFGDKNFEEVNNLKFYYAGLSDAIEILMNVAKVKARPVVECRDCKKMYLDDVYHDCWCQESGKKVWLDHFCGYGERKDKA